MPQAVVFTEYGGPDVLHLAAVPLPEPGEGEVRVRMRAAGVQPADSRLRSGSWQAWNPVTFPARLGNEGAGVIDAVGPGVTDVTGFAVGDEILGPASGAYAETVLFQADQIAARPASMPWAQAGALSASGQTADTVLEDLAVGPGDTLLVHAAAGGVGHLAVQLARLRGARVIGTASPDNHAFLRGLGAEPVAHGPGLADRIRALAPGGVDAALDGAGGEALDVSVEVVRDRTRIGTIADQAGAARLGVRALGTRRSGARLAALAGLAEKGDLRVSVWKEFPLAEVVAAHRESEGRHMRGKIVLTIGA